MPKLYHRTERAAEIANEGFRDSRWPDLGGDSVCFGSSIAATSSGHGDWIIEIEVPAWFLDLYRMRDATGDYEDTFFAPASVVNKYPRTRHHCPRSAT